MQYAIIYFLKNKWIINLFRASIFCTVVTYRFYDALCAREHCTHDGEILSVGHPPLAHVFKDFSGCRSSEGVFGVKAHICINACREDTKSSSEDKPWNIKRCISS